MQLIVTDGDGKSELRAAAAFCLMLAGDIAVPSLVDEEIKPAVPHGAGAGAVPAGTEQVSASGFRADVTTNVVPFPPAPPVPSIPGFVPAGVTPAAAAAVMAAAAAPLVNAPTALVPPPPAPVAPAGAMNLAAVVSAGPDEFDSAGLPWDARIHQKGKSKKKDGTWKLQKGLDPMFAQAVVTELAAKRRAAPAAGVPAPTVAPLGAGPLMPDPPRPVGMLPELGAPYGTTVQPQFNHASVPPPPNASQVPLPPPNFGPPANTGYGQPIAHGASAVPVPPQSNGAPASMVPPPPIAAQVPVAPQPGPTGGGNPAVSPYRLLMDKLTAAVGNKQLDPRRIAPVCQKHGAPNFAELGKPEYAHLVAGAERDFDSLIAGLPVEGIA